MGSQTKSLHEHAAMSCVPRRNMSVLCEFFASALQVLGMCGCLQLQHSGSLLETSQAAGAWFHHVAAVVHSYMDQTLPGLRVGDAVKASHGKPSQRAAVH